MSIQDARAALAAALSTVDGVKGYEYRPSAPVAGDAWPANPSYANAEDIILEPTWPVIVFLPQDARAQAVWVDAHIEAIWSALKGPGWPEEARPAVIAANGGEQDVYVFTVRSTE